MRDPETLLFYGMDAAVEAAGLRYALAKEVTTYRPGQPLKLLLAGYAGTRNTGGDVRVEEMIRQFRRIFGDRNMELTMFTIDPKLTAGYHRRVRQLQLPTVFPKFLYEECSRHHGVVACEGSMFKSKFANALSTMMGGAMAIAAVEGKLSVGYGGEAGAMDPPLQDFIRRRLQQSLVICRNSASQRILENLGVRTGPGTDTAWTFRCGPAEQAEAQLRRAGWDGQRPVVAMAPINPFWWPARPDFVKAAVLRFQGQFREEHYRDQIFHSWSAEDQERYDAYIEGMAQALHIHVERSGCFPILVGSERLDRQACNDVAERLGFDVPMFISDDYDMFELVALLRRCSMVVASRYHAIVNSMPAGVPSIGVTMDERITNLFMARGHGDDLFHADARPLGEPLSERMWHAHKEHERLRQETLSFLPSQLEVMAKMGMDFEDELRRIYPDFPFRDVPRTTEQYLPELSPELQQRLTEVA